MLIIPFEGTQTWIGENNREFEFFSPVYMAAQDVDSDGWSDEGSGPQHGEQVDLHRRTNVDVPRTCLVLATCRTQNRGA